MEQNKISLSDINPDEESGKSTRHSELTPIGKFDPENARFPICIVWTPLPLISCIFPFIGHTGVCDSRGVIYDFGGSHHISVDNFTFGSTHKYVKLNISSSHLNSWNSALDKANTQYKSHAHSLCCNNCHSHVAKVLQLFEYGGSKNHTMLSVWWMTVWRSKYLNYTYFVLGWVCVLVPVLIVLGLVWGAR